MVIFLPHSDLLILKNIFRRMYHLISVFRIANFNISKLFAKKKNQKNCSLLKRNWAIKEDENFLWVFAILKADEFRS